MELASAESSAAKSIVRNQRKVQRISLFCDANKNFRDTKYNQRDTLSSDTSFRYKMVNCIYLLRNLYFNIMQYYQYLTAIYTFFSKHFTVFWPFIMPYAHLYYA
jgi:hypothetical protein